MNSLQQLLADFRSAGQEMLEMSRTEAVAMDHKHEPATSKSSAGAAAAAAVSAATAASTAKVPPIDAAALERRQADMTAIKAAVDGAQLYLESNDRYLLREDDMVELNVESYQPVQVVHVYMFNDGLLIAVPRKSKSGLRKKLASIVLATAYIIKLLTREEYY